MSARDITAVRQFNRFHTRVVGALDEHLLASEFTMPQGRILYEIAHADREDAPSASDLAARLDMDAGYFSRLVSGLEKQGLVKRTPTPGNAKRLSLRLTRKGRATFEQLNDASSREIAELLEPLSPAERRELTGAMAHIRRLLGDAPGDKTFILRDPEPGDLGMIVHQQARLYTREYGWDWTFEGLAAEIVGQFAKNFIRGRERCWVAERDGEIVGAVFVTQEDETTARLRLLHVAEAARGMGLGRKLVDECLRFARGKGYTRMILWTNDVLVSARRIYQAAGFRLIEEEKHHSFGKDLVGQVWECTL